MKKIIDFAIKNPVLITALLCVVFYFLPFKPKPFGDGQFHTGTQQLIEYILNGFQGNINIDKGFLTLFCYLIPYSVVYAFHNDDLFFYSGVIFNCIFVCLAVYYLFKTFSLLHFTDKAKFAVLLLMSLFPIHIYYAMGILGEAFGFFASTMMIYFWSKHYNGIAQKRDYLFLALSIVLLYGIKPSMLPFTFVMTLYFLMLKTPKVNKLYFALGIAFIPIFILVERSLDDSNFEFKNRVFRNQILWSRYELRDEPFNWLPQHGQDKFASGDYLNNLKKRHELDSICKVNNYDRTAYFIQWVKNDILSNPGLTARQYSLKFFQAQSFIISPLMKSDKSKVVKYGIHIYINAINYVLVFTGLFALYRLFRRKKYLLFFPFLFFWGWGLLYVFVFHSEQRYMFPVRPLLIFLFAYWVSTGGFNKKAALSTS
ncbi:hypothetical protein [Flavobacterium sp.]|jgi:hypothetical protein|uniref:hypothetical protein n=1 Tax=Flavobacterium sp. TaxID=239 RepID=UPI0037BF2D18